MKTRSGARKALATCSVMLVVAALLVPVGISAAATVPPPGISGCDVLLTAPVGHHCLLPWPNDAFTAASATATGRRLNISSKVDPAN